MLKRFGKTQVCEYRLTQSEVDQLIIQNAAQRLDPSYDFVNPVLLKEKDEYIIRFVQKFVVADGAERSDHFEPFQKTNL